MAHLATRTGFRTPRLDGPFPVLVRLFNDSPSAQVYVSFLPPQKMIGIYRLHASLFHRMTVSQVSTSSSYTCFIYARLPNPPAPLSLLPFGGLLSGDHSTASLVSPAPAPIATPATKTPG